MKLSHKIINQMPTRTLDEVKAREAAAETLREAEAFVAKHEDMFEKTMALDGTESDASKTDGVVTTSSKNSADDSYESIKELASKLGGVMHYSRTEKSSTPSSQYRDYFASRAEEVTMESDNDRGRVTFKVTSTSSWSKKPSQAEDLTISKKAKPHKFISVEGEGEDRVFRLEPQGTLSRLWEGATGVVGSIGRIFAPLKGMMPQITITRKNAKPE